MAVLVAGFYGREANEAERVAMSGEMQRDAQWIAPHSYGRDGGLFHIEPSGFDALMTNEIGMTKEAGR